MEKHFSRLSSDEEEVSNSDGSSQRKFKLPFSAQKKITPPTLQPPPMKKGDRVASFENRSAYFPNQFNGAVSDRGRNQVQVYPTWSSPEPTVTHEPDAQHSPDRESGHQNRSNPSCDDAISSDDDQSYLSVSTFNDLDLNNDEDWRMSLEQRDHYAKHFKILTKGLSGTVEGDLARDFFLKSNLSTEQLSHIWTLADIDGDNALNQDEFSIAMHLIIAVQAGIPLPTDLPKVLRIEGDVESCSLPLLDSSEVSSDSSSSKSSYKRSVRAEPPVGSNRQELIALDQSPRLLRRRGPSSVLPGIQAGPQLSPTGRDLNVFCSRAGIPDPESVEERKPTIFTKLSFCEVDSASSGLSLADNHHIRDQPPRTDWQGPSSPPHSFNLQSSEPAQSPISSSARVFDFHHPLPVQSYENSSSQRSMLDQASMQPNSGSPSCLPLPSIARPRPQSKGVGVMQIVSDMNKASITDKGAHMPLKLSYMPTPTSASSDHSDLTDSDSSSNTPRNIMQLYDGRDSSDMGTPSPPMTPRPETKVGSWFCGGSGLTTSVNPAPIGVSNSKPPGGQGDDTGSLCMSIIEYQSKNAILKSTINELQHELSELIQQRVGLEERVNKLLASVPD